MSTGKVIMYGSLYPVIGIKGLVSDEDLLVIEK